MKQADAQTKKGAADDDMEVDNQPSDANALEFLLAEHLNGLAQREKYSSWAGNLNEPMKQADAQTKKGAADDNMEVDNQPSDANPIQRTFEFLPAEHLNDLAQWEKDSSWAGNFTDMSATIEKAQNTGNPERSVDPWGFAVARYVSERLRFYHQYRDSETGKFNLNGIQCTPSRKSAACREAEQRTSHVDHAAVASGFNAFYDARCAVAEMSDALEDKLQHMWDKQAWEHRPLALERFSSILTLGTRKTLGFQPLKVESSQRKIRFFRSRHWGLFGERDQSPLVSSTRNGHEGALSQME
ncbi:MAG: hypothetical protein Q9196_005910 [Gyalolechia fulgens]